MGDPDEFDRCLVERAQRGDRQAFGQIYQRHVARVYSFLLFRVRERSVAEDLTQEVFIQALRSVDRFDWRGALAPWLLRIARNAVVDHWRRSARRPERPLSVVEAGDDEDGETRMDRTGDVGDAPSLEAIENGIDRARVARAAERLTRLQQQVLSLRFAAGLTVRETAMVMNKSEGAIKNLQHHALRTLKRHLGDDGVIE